MSAANKPLDSPCIAVLINEEKLLTVIIAPTPIAIHTIKNINLCHAPRDSAKANENNCSRENLFFIITQ